LIKIFLHHQQKGKKRNSERKSLSISLVNKINIGTNNRINSDGHDIHSSKIKFKIEENKTPQKKHKTAINEIAVGVSIIVIAWVLTYLLTEFFSIKPPN